MKKPEIIKEETQREAIINRPHNLAGSINPIKKERFNITNESIKYGESTIVPALLKLFMESLDNPIDVAIKGGCDKIDIKVDSNSIEVKDNGYGIDTRDIDGESVLFKAFCKYNTSSNYGDNRGQGQKGVNGIGIKLCTTLSSHLLVVSEDINGRVKLIVKENNLIHTVSKQKQTGKTGVSVKFTPDFNIFDCIEIDNEHIKRMYEYTLLQALTYPNIRFTFNSKVVSYTPKKFISMLNDINIVESYNDFFIAVTPNETDDFKQISYINGLETSKGGTHINYVIDNIVNRLREKIIKKYKTIKPADIRNRLTLVVIAKNVREIDWDGQTKESITTPNRYFIEYFKDIDFDKLVDKIYKNKDIINPIVDYFRIKEEYKKQQELKGLEKPTKKKPDSEKFLEPIGEWRDIYLAEGDSASSSLASIIGRDKAGHYAMFGKPPNAYDMTMSNILKSDKLRDFTNILGIRFSKTTQTDINFQNIIIAADEDIAGYQIRSLLIGMFYKYGKNLIKEGRIKVLKTPLFMCTDNKDNIIDWFYDFESQRNHQKETKGKYKYEYKKGLSSWDKEELQVIIDREGIEQMLEVMYIEDEELTDELIDKCLNGKRASDRKDMLDGYEFSILEL